MVGGYVHITAKALSSKKLRAAVDGVKAVITPSVGLTEESCPHLPGVVPGDVRSGVQLRSGCAVEHQSLAFQSLHGLAAVQFDFKDAAHCRRTKE